MIGDLLAKLFSKFLFYQGKPNALGRWLSKATLLFRCSVSDGGQDYVHSMSYHSHCYGCGKADCNKFRVCGNCLKKIKK